MSEDPPVACLAGQPWPLGATPMARQGRQGVNFAAFSRHATSVHACLFDAQGGRETGRVPLLRSPEGIWHGFVPGLAAGQLYGLRADGPWHPEAGHRFNPARLLIDPWAIELVGDCDRLSLERGHLGGPGPLMPDPHDNAHRMPKARVVDAGCERAAGAAVLPGPAIPPEHVILYEAHVKGLTRLHPAVPPDLRGTYAGLASEPMLAHYRRLGITTLCLMPVQQHIDERHLLALGLRNHWGYNTLAPFAPEPGYGSRGATGQALRDEFRAMVDRLHRAGLEVVLDVVFNHTAESDLEGPTLSWRGLDHASAYALDARGAPLDFTGCGNAVNAAEPQLVRWIMDCLRWWVEAFGVDGFRFDLAATLGRDPRLQYRFHPAGALFAAMAQDPILCRVRRIAEPWDVSMGGYQLGAFPPGWQEWNDTFRDTVRAYWLGHECTPGQMARRMAGSDDLFRHHGRGPLASINLVTAHDGFTLADLTAYRLRHNQANGEDNRDGHGDNFSANAGVEGPSHDPEVLRLRAAWQRALLATLLLSQGTPQLLAGDELGNSQGGNNNAYCQDNPIGWLDWPSGPHELTLWVSLLTGLRRRYPALRHARWFDGHPFHAPGRAYEPGADIAWLRPDGLAMSDADWDDPWRRSFACVIEVGEGARRPTERVMVLNHPGAGSLTFVLPAGPWRLMLDSGEGASPTREVVHATLELGAPALCILVQSIGPASTSTQPVDPPQPPTQRP
jgi:glycogen debranching enzyme GlgX